MSITVQPSADEESRVADIVERIHSRFPAVDREFVDEVVHEVHRTYSAASIRDFIPILVERDARDVVSHRSTSAPV